MEDVDKNEVEELMYPEEVGGGEPRGLQPQRGRCDQAGDRHGEDGPAIEQGWVLLKGEQVSAIPATWTNKVINPWKNEQMITTDEISVTYDDNKVPQ